MQIKRIFCLSDIHAPYHNKRTLGIKIRAGVYFKPDILYADGDMVDLYSASHYRKSHKRTLLIKKELDKASHVFDALLAIGAKRNIMLMGNHEDRFKTYITDNAPGLEGITSVEKELKLKEKGWEVVPYGKSVKIGDTRIVHDQKKAGPTAAVKAMCDYQSSVILGHTHYATMSWYGNGKGGIHTAAMFGHGADPVKADYAAESHKLRNWVDGVGFGYLLPNGTVHWLPGIINRGVIMVEGKPIR
jgi:predicted phosphodiesterase